MDESELSEIARKVTSGPLCPRCHFAMEPGYVVPASSPRISWHDPDPEDRRPGAKIEELWTATEHGTVFLKWFRCPECQYLELGYGKGGLTRDGWKTPPTLP